MPIHPPTPARILLVDDRPIVRLGVRQVVAAEPAFSICGETGAADEALELARSTNADLAITSLRLNQGSGLALIREFREQLPQLGVLVLSTLDEKLFAERALRAGARGYVMLWEPVSVLVSAIQRVLAGEIHLSEEMSQHFFVQLHRGGFAAHVDLANLTDREIEVLEMIGRGASTAAIADRLRISVKTVETYRLHLKTKLNLQSAADLIRFAVVMVMASAASTLES